MAAPVHVIVAGAGVAGLETLLALRALAGDRAAVTLLSPADTFVLGAASVGTPFGHGPAAEHAIASIAAEHGAELVRDALQGVRREDRTAVLRTGDPLHYDELVVAVGATPEPVFAEALTFRGARDVDAVTATVRELEAGRLASIAFVVPLGISWPLPLYELALLSAAHADLYGLDVELTFVTPEPAPFAGLGREVAVHAESALDRAGVTVMTRAAVHDVDAGGGVLDRDGQVLVRADRVLALPRLRGPALPGLPHDDDGFLPADERGAVADRVYAAGDVTASLPKHGGLGAQQAESVAREIAQRAGAAVTATAGRPVVRARLMEGPRSTFLRVPLGARETATGRVLSEDALWWPPLKVAAPRLAAYLASEGWAS
jgi:sulfide:quinone oxidoreductase